MCVIYYYKCQVGIPKIIIYTAIHIIIINMYVLYIVHTNAYNKIFAFQQYVLKTDRRVLINGPHEKVKT